MQLHFDESVTFSKNNADQLQVVQFWDNQIQIFYLQNGSLYTEFAQMDDQGDWDGLQFRFRRQLLEHEEDISFLNIHSILDDAVIGTYIAKGVQKLFKYEY